MKTKLTSILIICLFAFNNYSSADQIPEQWKRMLQLVGNWEGNLHLKLGDQSFNLKYKTDFKSSVNGSAMTMNESFSDKTLGMFEGLNLIGFNSSDSLIHWFSVDNYGTAHEHTGYWSTSSDFLMEHTSMQSGQKLTEKISLKLHHDNKKADLELVKTLGNEITETLKGTLMMSGNGFMPEGKK